MQKEAAELLVLLQRHRIDSPQFCVLTPLKMTLAEMASLANVSIGGIEDTAGREQVENLQRRVTDGIRDLHALQVWSLSTI